MTTDTDLYTETLQRRLTRLRDDLAYLKREPLVGVTIANGSVWKVSTVVGLLQHAIELTEKEVSR